MAKVSRFEPTAQAFLPEHPHHSSVSERALLTFARQHANGLAPDLAQVDPSKQVQLVRRHINQGGASPNLPEEERFQLQVVDQASGAMIVMPFAEFAIAKSESVLEKSLRSAIGPINSTQRLLDGIKIDELTAEERDAVEAAQAETSQVAAQVKPMFGRLVEGRYVQRLTAAGVSPDEALKVIGVLAQAGKLQKLLALTR